jgi:hypothetical protein
LSVAVAGAGKAAYAESRVPVVPEQGVTFVRRVVNETTYEQAIREGLDDDTPLEFLCECGDPDCIRQVSMLLSEFNRSTPAGAIAAHDA